MVDRGRQGPALQNRTALLIEDPDRSLSFTLSQRYLGEDPPVEPDDVMRLMVRIVPEKVITFAA